MKILALVIGLAAAFAVGAIAINFGLRGGSDPASLPQCYDAAVRFPESSNPQAALDQALRASGANPAATGDPAVQAIRANKSVLDLRTSLWVIDSLWAQRNNQPTRSLTDTLKSALDDQSYLAPQNFIYTWVWGDVQSWPPESCEGVFLRNPRNASLIAPVARLPRQ